MWLPTPLYERIPQFWFLLGLLFLASGLYLGFEFALSFWYVAAGFVCCAVGAGTFVLRLNNRQAPQGIQQTDSAPVSEPVEPVHAEPAHAE
jgi:hypothetical protein